MAKVTGSAVMGSMSGRFGTAVIAQTQDGLVLRARPEGSDRRSPAQRAQDVRMANVNRAWDALTFEQATAWRAYAFSLAARNPATGGLRVPSAYGLFTGLSTKYLQIHGGTVAPSIPPTGRFNGDVVNVEVSGGTNQATFNADRANAPGVLTVLLGQRLSGPNNLPKTKSYVSLGFVSLEEGVPVAVEIGKLGTWAFAISFVEASSGRKTELVEIGRANVTGEWI